MGAGLQVVAVTAVVAVLLTGCVASPVAPLSPDAGQSSACAESDAVQVTATDSDIQSKLDRAGVGATICFGPGEYRLSDALMPQADQTLIGDGAILTGARELTDFQHSSAGWTVGDQSQEGERTGTCLDNRAECTYPDDVVRDGTALVRVLSLSRLETGTYYFDYAHDQITVYDDPLGHSLLAMVAPAAIVSQPGATGVTVSGFTVRYYATRAQHGAIETSEPGWLIDHNRVELNHGAGITSGGDVTISGNTVVRNGQLGIGGTGPSTGVIGNEIAFNNTGGFDPGWEAGGAKWAVTTDLDVERNDVHDNLGPGLWTDIDAQNTTYADNIVANNARAGIFHEISGAATIRDNVVTGNGHGYDGWLWGSGILIAGSHDVTVTGNVLEANAQGIGLIQQDRGISDVDGRPRTVHDIAITDNTVSMAGGLSGAVTDNGFDQMFSDASITWAGNTWNQSAGLSFAWDDRELDAAGWQSLGFDTNGTFRP